MRPDPPVRKDGLCAVCLGPRRVPKGVWAREAADLDPFCCVEHCRVYHGTPIRVMKAGGQRKYAA